MNNRDNIYFWHCVVPSKSHRAAAASLLCFTARDFMSGAGDSAAIGNLLC